MSKGFTKSILFYLVGLSLAGLSYLIVGHEYVHGPGLHHIIILLTFVIGFLWLVISTILFFTGERTKPLSGVILTNLVMSIGFAIFMAYIIYDSTHTVEYEKNLSKVVVEKSEDTTTMYHGGTPVYMKVKDSVMFDFIDSTRVDWSEVEVREK
jgi:hypothetical protein